MTKYVIKDVPELTPEVVERMSADLSANVVADCLASGVEVLEHEERPPSLEYLCYGLADHEGHPAWQLDVYVCPSCSKAHVHVSDVRTQERWSWPSEVLDVFLAQDEEAELAAVGAIIVRLLEERERRARLN